MDPKEDFTTNFRTEIGALFGVRWDSFVEWLIIAWLSIWFWFSAFPNPQSSSNERSIPWSNGPISDGVQFMVYLDAPYPSWLTSVRDWLHMPEYHWIYWLLITASVLACVNSVRSVRHTGLRVVSLILTAAACEISGGLRPVLFVILMSAVPAAFACILGWRDTRTGREAVDSGQYYFSEGIVIKFFTRIVFLFLQIPLAPFVVLAALVTSFRTDLHDYSAEELTRRVTDFKSKNIQSDANPCPLEDLAGYAGIQLAGNNSHEARRVLWHYIYALDNKGLRSRG